MARVSLTEQYDDKDVIKQIYKIWDAVDKGTVKDLNVVRDNGNIKITVKFHNDETKEFTLEDDEIQNVTQAQSGSQVTITIVMKSGTTYPFTFTAATGVTLDTDQTVSGMKVFSAASTNFSHDVDVGADLNVGGTVEANELTVDTDATVDGQLIVGGDAQITGKMTDDVTIASSHSLEFESAGAIEPSNSDLVISPAGRLLVKTSNGSDLEAVFSSANGLQVDKLAVTTSATAPTVRTSAASNSIATKGYVEATDGVTNNVVHRTANETINGNKTFVNPIFRTHSVGGQESIQIKAPSGNCYPISVKDNNNVVRGQINTQMIDTSDHQSRFIFTISTDDYNKTAGTGASANLILEVKPDGTADIKLTRTKGDGSVVSKTVALITGSE